MNERLLATWKQWDQQPGARGVVVALEEEIKKEAAARGISGSRFRDLVSSCRRGGMKLAEALS